MSVWYAAALSRRATATLDGVIRQARATTLRYASAAFAYRLERVDNMARSLKERTELELVANNELGALLAQMKSETLASYRTLLDNVYAVLNTRQPTRHETYTYVEGKLAELTGRLAKEGWQERDVVNVLRIALSHDD